MYNGVIANWGYGFIVNLKMRYICTYIYTVYLCEVRGALYHDVCSSIFSHSSPTQTYLLFVEINQTDPTANGFGEGGLLTSRDTARIGELGMLPPLVLGRRVDK